MKSEQTERTMANRRCQTPAVEGPPGSIYRVALENFVTYTSVELYPGPNLNLMIGPNGTGKSTFICAIVLGLGGKPTVLGRAKKIGEFVRSGCTEASVEIELFGENGSRLVITRSFNTDNATVWSVDKQAVKEKRVLEAVAALNIRVDNLCQLLPQDRVQDFAKMNPRELLRSTQLAVGGGEAVDLLDRLVNTKVSHRNAEAKLKTNRQQLAESEALNNRLEVIIAAMEEEKKLKKEIDICGKKRSWIDYEHTRNEVNTLKKDKAKAEKQLSTFETRMKPLNRELAKLNNQYGECENSKKKISAASTRLKSNVDELVESSDAYNSKIDEIKSDWTARLDQNRNKQREIDHAKLTLSKICSDHDNIIKTDGNEATLNKNLEEIHKPIKFLNSKLNDLRENKQNCQYEIDSRIGPQIRSLENKLNDLRSADNKKMELLKQYSQHAFEAVLWLRNNRHLFKHEVCEPMILELSFDNPKFAKYLENTVANRDLLAFTFVDSEDMTLFLKEVKQGKGLKMVNAVCASPHFQRISPPYTVNDLRSFGFSNYLVNLVKGPAPIMNFLCSQYNIHKIPIGNDKTYNMSHKVPSEINYFYSENHKFITRISAYSKAKSTSTSEIREAKLLAINIDQLAISNAKKQLDNCLSERAKKVDIINKMNEQVQKCEGELNASMEKRQNLQGALERVKSILSRIRMQQNKISNLENEPPFDHVAERKKIVLAIKDCKKKQELLQPRILAVIKNLEKNGLESSMFDLEINITYKMMLKIKQDIADIDREAAETKRILENIANQYTKALSTAKSKLTEAKAQTNNLLPDQPGFPYRDEFAELPDDLNGLEQHIAMLQGKIDCMDSCDPGAIQDYKNRQLIIKKLKDDIQNNERCLNNAEEEMLQLREQWLMPLETQVNNINEKFSEMFAQLGCAGEVRILKEGTDDEYDKYGISIMVKFREEQKLQQLNQHVQSGGERALSTALYLMALQQLSKAPFRCVDEVNQGMDPINERKMFQLLVKVMTECDTSSQYFLLTPKLLYDLEHSPSIRVHTIMNGPRAVKYNKWNIREIINNAKLHYK